MQILLIRPPMRLLSNEIPSVVFPLGLGYIAAYLEKNGHDVRVLDAVAYGVTSHNDNDVHLGMSWKDIEKFITNKKYDVVGISCSFSSQAENTHKTAELVKKFDGSTKIFVGGAHPSSSPHELLKDENIDVVIMGEGEITSYKYVSNIDKDLSKINGLAFREGKKIIVNPKREYIKNLDDLPFPARRLFPMGLYLQSKHGHGVDIMRTPKTEIITSRGCPGKCIYCSIHTVWGRSWRPRSPENVVDEIELLYNEYGVREIQFEDDNLSLHTERLYKICQLIIDRGLDIKWTTPNGIAVWCLNEELLMMMKKAGCYKLTFGIESACPETQKYIGKNIDLQKAKKIIQYANKIGIWTHTLFIIGFPDEKMDSINQTFKFAIESDADFASFFIATPYPGTELYNRMRNENLISDKLNWAQLRVSSAAAPTHHFSKEELEKLQKKLFINFFKRRVLSFINPYTLWIRLRRMRRFEDVRFISRFLLRFIQVAK